MNMDVVLLENAGVLLMYLLCVVCVPSLFHLSGFFLFFLDLRKAEPRQPLFRFPYAVLHLPLIAQRCRLCPVVQGSYNTPACAVEDDGSQKKVLLFVHFTVEVFFRRGSRDECSQSVEGK